MTRPNPPDLLARIEAYERWLETGRREGQQFRESKVDLHGLDLSNRQLVMALLPEANLNQAIWRDAALSSTLCNRASFVGVVLDGAWLVKATLARLLGRLN
jgi:uncharacterized protein YjbI with pentapeptide repeats